MNATTVKLSVRQWASEDRPSNKLQTLGAEALTDSEPSWVAALSSVMPWRLVRIL